MRKSPTVYLIIVNVVIFLLTMGGNLFAGALANTYPATIGNLELYRLLTCMFFHFGIMHLLCNMFSLFQLGIVIEQMYSKKTLIFVYFTTGILSSLGSCILHEFLGQSVLSAGASGAICGLIGFLIGNMRSRIRNSFGNILMALLPIIVIGFSPGVDNLAHWTGCIAGILIGLVYRK